MIDLIQENWRVVTHECSEARLEYSSAERSHLCVTITRVVDPVLWHVQLLGGPLQLESGQRYVLAFRVRADRLVQIAASIGQDHTPWQEVGLYCQLEAQLYWRAFEIRFAASATDMNVRIQFDVGAIEANIEFSDVTFRKAEHDVLERQSGICEITTRLDRELLQEYNKTRRTANDSVFCHAPFSSMNFEQNGRVTVCCYNRTNILGYYPHDSLHEMWLSQEAARLRHFMRDRVLPTGCSICENQFQSKNWKGLRAGYYDHLAQETSQTEDMQIKYMPKVLEFEINNKCNLECIMCTGYYSSKIRRNREHLPPIESPYDAQFVEQLRLFVPHLKEARFLGGEPFLIKLYYQIWDLISLLNPTMKVCITTNGGILNDRIEHLLERLSVAIIVSIDSLERDNYERIRVGADYGRVMDHVEYFMEYARKKGVRLGFVVCPMQQNWKELPNILEYCNDREIELSFNTVLRPAEASLSTMPADVIGKVIGYLNEPVLRENSIVACRNNSVYQDVIRQIKSYYDLALNAAHEEKR